MERRTFIKTGVAVGVVSTLASKVVAGANGGKRPNLVIVFPDQMHNYAMGFLKKEPVYTPNLDRFASESLVLTVRY